MTFAPNYCDLLGYAKIKSFYGYTKEGQISLPTYIFLSIYLNIIHTTSCSSFIEVANQSSG